MKVLFTFGGLPHYYNYVLSKLNTIENLEIIVVVPAYKGKTFGKGVYQDTEGINFKVYELEEYKTFYQKYFFKDFLRIIEKEKPEIIVTIWPYILAFIFKFSLLRIIRRRNIKLTYKQIPFNLPLFKDGISFNVKAMPDENLRVSDSIFFKLNILFVTFIRKIIFNMVNAHVNYIEDAYRILGSYGVEKEKIFITYNSPNTDSLLKAKEKADSLEPILPYNDYRIIHLGRLVKWKRVDLLIKAVSELKKKYKEIELVVIGKGPEEAALKELAEDLNLIDKVRFVGAVYDSVTLGRYFDASSVYVLGGMGGLSINEAMVYEKPIVCSVCDGTEKKLVRDGYNGKFFKENDLSDLVEKIDFILNDQIRLKQMGKNSLEIIKNEVNIHTVIKGYIKAFNYVTNNKYNLNYKDETIF